PFARPAATRQASAIPEPELPSARPVGSVAPAEWLAELPDLPPTAQKGERVWATIPGRATELPIVGIFSVEGIYDGYYSLLDLKGQRVDHIPSALVHRATRARLKGGEVVLFYTPSAPAFLGRVGELVPGGHIEVSYDWAGETKRAKVDHAEPPVDGIRPMAYVSFPKSGDQSRGLVVALDDLRAFIRTASGHVERHPRAGVRSLPIPRADWEVGARVLAHRWAIGMVTGTVSEVLEGGLRYRIAVDGHRPSLTVFFTELFPR
ncbi:MAG: hypothetical protein KC731_21960, partial [Myxococcales bacterium]|nr:hypothetical protein [Myxococcales bacterium]